MPAPIILATHRPTVNDRDRYQPLVEDDDPLRTMRGLVHGIIGGLCFWGAILATVWLWWS